MRDATPEEIADALQFDGRKRNHQADSLMARIVAERLVQHLERCGFVLMKRPEAKPHSAPAP